VKDKPIETLKRIMFVHIGEMSVFILGRWCHVRVRGDGTPPDFNELFTDHKTMALPA
jgi:hypothetical protein